MWTGKEAMMLGLIREFLLNVTKRRAERVAMDHSDERSHSDRQRLGLQRYAAYWFATLLALLNLGLGGRHPLIREYLSLGMMVLAIPLFGISMTMYGRYSKVYDYEPTSPLGRPTNGASARRVLLNAGKAALALGVTGFVFWFLRDL
jgi:hypothetical protein